MIKKLLSVGVVLILFFLAVHVEAATFCTGDVVLDVTQHYSNYTDLSHYVGAWAIDDFDRQIQIYDDLGQYCAETIDKGTFTSIGGEQGRSPQSGRDMPQVITGVMTGGTNGLVSGTLGDAGGWGSNPPSIDCDVAPDVCSSDLRDLNAYWASNYFSGGTYDYNHSWGWDYLSTLGEGWLNVDGDSDIHAIVNTSSHKGYATLEEAIATASLEDTIILGGDVVVSTPIDIAKPLTIDGNGFTLHAPFVPLTDEAKKNPIGLFSRDLSLKNLKLEFVGEPALIEETPLPTPVSETVVSRSRSGPSSITGTSAPVGQVLGAATSLEEETQVEMIKTQLRTLITQLISMLQDQLHSLTP